MKLTREQLKRDEVLRYLGYRGTEIPSHTERLIEDCIQETLDLVQPSFLYHKYPIQEQAEGLLVEGTGMCMTGQDICRHLEGCREVYLLCATVGSLIDKHIRRKMVEEPAAGVILDSCGSVAVEQVAELAEAEIEREVMSKGKHITWRFSPGYGDLPLSLQQELADILDLHRKLGVSVSEDMLLAPSKSVTAIVGVMESVTERKSNKEARLHKAGDKGEKCERCMNRERCNFYMKGKSCFS